MTVPYTSTGIILILVATVAWGGSFLLRVVNKSVAANDLQRSYFRAGHAHAGVLLMLGLLVRLMVYDPEVPWWGRTCADAILLAAIAMPAGFFLSVVGKDPARPNELRWLIVLGGLLLTIGVMGAGSALVVAGRHG